MSEFENRKCQLPNRRRIKLIEDQYLIDLVKDEEFIGEIETIGESEGTIIENDWKLSIRTKETAEFSNAFIEPKADDGDISPLEKFINACIDGTGTPDGLDLDAAITLTQLLESAYISDKTNTTVAI